jgi:AsmA protein
MRKALKILAWLLGLLLIAVVAIVTAVVLFFDPDDYRDEIAAMVKQQMGRDLTIEGDTAWSLYPWLGLRLNQVTLGNLAGFGPEPFAQVQHANVRVQLLPLLRGEVTLDKLVLEGLRLNLVVDATGRGNWANPEAAEKDDSGVPPALGVLAIGGIDVRDASIGWTDRREGTHMTVDELALQSERIVPGEPFPLEVAFRFQGPEGWSGRVSADTTATVYPDAQRYLLDAVQAKAQIAGPGVPGGPLDLQLAGSFNADLKEETLHATKLRVQALGAEATGEIQGAKIQSAPHWTGSLRVAQFNPRAVIEHLGQSVPQTSDPQALTRGTADLKFESTPEALQLAPVTAQLDESTLQGTAQIPTTPDETLRFDLTLDSLDLDRYRPPQAAQGAPATPAAAAAPAAATPAPATPATAAAAAGSALPVDTLRDLRLEGDLKAGKLRAAGLWFQDLALHVSAREGRIQLHPAKAEFYGGQYQGNVRLDAAQTPPRLALDDTINGVQLQSLLRDLQGLDWLVGRGDVSAKLSATGLSADQLRTTLAGQAAFSFADGAIKGINLAELIRQAKAKIEGKTLPPSGAPNQTDFTDLSGTLAFENGVARNDDLLLKSPLFRINGAGTANLMTEELDYLLKASVVATLEGQGGKDLEGLKGVTVPVKVEGSFSEPRFGLDVDTLLKERAKSKLDEKKQELQQKLEDKLRERLKGIF